MYSMRAVGGTIYLLGAFLMAYNLYRTAKGKTVEDTPVSAAPREKIVSHKGEYWHKWIERRPIQMLVAATVLVLIGGLIEILPMLFIDKNVPKIENVMPYTALELEGRDIYIREGCNTCHTQMIRPFRSETERYGDFSKSGEFIYDRPHLWGSKRTGPDVHRIGNKYPDSWHYAHMYDPTSMSPGSIMPAYPWIIEDNLDTDYTKAKMKVLKSLGTPYSEQDIENADTEMYAQALKIAQNLNNDGINDENLESKEIVALIAYLQRLGTDATPSKISN